MLGLVSTRLTQVIQKSCLNRALCSSQNLFLLKWYSLKTMRNIVVCYELQLDVIRMLRFQIIVLGGINI